MATFKQDQLYTAVLRDGIALFGVLFLAMSGCQKKEGPKPETTTPVAKGSSSSPEDPCEIPGCGVAAPITSYILETKPVDASGLRPLQAARPFSRASAAKTDVADSK